MKKHGERLRMAALARLLVAALGLLTATAGFGEATPQAGAAEHSVPVPKAKPRHQRLDSILNRVVEAFGDHVRSAPKTSEEHASTQAAAAARAAAVLAPMSDGASVAVTLRFDDASTVAAVVRFLQANGGDPRNVSDDYVEAYVPVALLVEASAQPGVARIQAIVPPQPKRGTVTSEGVGVHGADNWHAAGFAGAGVKVGVIDGGYNSLRSLMGSELPASIDARCYTDMGRYTSDLADCADGGDHGTAVAEAIMDVAPNARLYIADPGSKGDLQRAAQWMAAQGVQVINHSVGWPWDGFGNGTSPHGDSPLRTVDAAVARGVVWVNAAGNEGQSAWLGRFVDSNRDGYHEFQGGYQCNPITVRTSDELQVQLRWEGRWGVSSQMADLDLYLTDADVAGFHVLAESTEQNPISRFYPGTGEPTEILHYTASADESYCIWVHWSTAGYSYLAPAPRWVQLVVLTSQQLQFGTTGSIGNPAESRNRGLLAAGAAAYGETYNIRSYSSRGPTPDGRIKPDIVGVDGALSSSMGWWFGTSQASPHVAGLAALAREIWPHYAPGEIAGYLASHALDRGARGQDYDWGYGLAQLPPIGYEAEVANNPTEIPLSQLFAGADSATTYRAISSNPHVATATVRRGALVLAPATDDSEGRAVVRLTATYRNGATAVRHIVVNVVGAAPTATIARRFGAGWRAALYAGGGTMSTTPSTTPFRDAFAR